MKKITSKSGNVSVKTRNETVIETEKPRIKESAGIRNNPKHVKENKNESKSMKVEYRIMPL